MDTIWNCAFGLDIDIQNNPSNDYFTKCEDAFSNTWKLNALSYFGLYFYEFKELMIDVAVAFYGVFGSVFGKIPPSLWLREKVFEIVEKRRISKVNRKDYVQLLLDAQANSSENHAFDDNSNDLTSMNMNKTLSSHVNFLWKFSNKD